MTMENQPWMKMYLLFKMVIFQAAILVFGGMVYNCSKLQLFQTQGMWSSWVAIRH